ncbi:MAG: M15 family metallopeptidase [Prevotella sp.]|nr:M15 family metallopeptidase [Staphylococcus sp.]MCM1350023.1 M15 family metallopeptidase [Prevotella sp.]
MKLLKSYVLILTCFTFFGLQECASSQKEKTNPFYAKISQYSSFQPALYEQYEQIYQENHNMVYTLNLVNHPSFLKQGEYDSFAFDDHYLFVNPYFRLKANFTPSQLEKVTLPKIHRQSEVMLIDSTTQKMYQQLYTEATSLGLELVIFSAYRSYAYQSHLYEQAKNPNYVAKPGASEHQTGCAIDIATLDTGLSEYFEQTAEFDFLKENAHRFGFILRYPKGKEHITGYPYESWHFRYVGVSIASKIYHSNLTLEEYIYQYVEII